MEAARLSPPHEMPIDIVLAPSAFNAFLEQLPVEDRFSTDTLPSTNVILWTLYGRQVRLMRGAASGPGS